VSVETGTRENHTIVDGLTALPDRPADAAQPGASGQRQMLQPAGTPPAPPEAQVKGVSASNDLLIRGGRRSRSSHLTRSGGLRLAHLPPGTGKEAPSESSAGGHRLQPGQRAAGRHVSRSVEAKRLRPSRGSAARSGSCFCRGRAFRLRSVVRQTRQPKGLPSSSFLGARQNAAPSLRNSFLNGLLATTPKARETSKVPREPAGQLWGTTRVLACLSLRAGEGPRSCLFVRHENLCAGPANRGAVHSAGN